jgi:hypothetical protein
VNYLRKYHRESLLTIALGLAAAAVAAGKASAWLLRETSKP